MTPEPVDLSGAEALLVTLVNAGLDTCFMNPGTSEMHFVKALDTSEGMRGVLTLFEGVATGAADGYARIARRPAAALLHLGPGLGNGYANLHNARRAHTPLVCIVGVHAADHVGYDAPLQLEVEAIARTLDGWVRTSGTSRSLPVDAARAVAASQSNGGQIATLIVPADASWKTGANPAAPRPVPVRTPSPAAACDIAAEWLREGASTLLLLGGPALDEPAVLAADAIRAATGASVLVETFPSRVDQGGDLPSFDRIPYLPEMADAKLAGIEKIVLAGAAAPATFFGYPGRSGDLVGERPLLPLCDVNHDVAATLQGLAEALDAPPTGPAERAVAPEVSPGESLDVMSLVQVVAATLPEGAIVVDELNTSGLGLPAALKSAPRHSLLTLTGGAIGQGMPVATGAALAAPERRVFSLEADGSAAYTIQSLWTQARENLRVTTVLVNNAAYAILRMELQRTGAGAPGTKARAMLDLDSPVLDFTAISTGFGVPARRVTTTTELQEALAEAERTDGPFLIEAIVPAIA